MVSGSAWRGIRLDVFDLRERVIDQHSKYVRSFCTICEPSTCQFVDGYLILAARDDPSCPVECIFEPGAARARRGSARWRL